MLKARLHQSAVLSVLARDREEKNYGREKNDENLSQNYPLETTFCLETSFSVMSRLVTKKMYFVTLGAGAR